MALWVDRYRPNSLEKCDAHPDIAKHLLRITESSNFPHILLSGCSGSGKRTLINCLLRQIYGSGVDKIRLEHPSFTTLSNKKIEIGVISSNYHLEVHPSDVEIYDRLVIQDLIKTVASTQQLDRSSRKHFKIVVIMDADKLTTDAQHALRRTMEKYSASCRIVLCAVSPTRLISAIRSRCLQLRIPRISKEKTTEILRNILQKECGNGVPGGTPSQQYYDKIVEFAAGNLRRAVVMLESAYVEQLTVTRAVSSEWVISYPDWYTYIADTAALILSEQSPKKLLEVRGRLYELLSHCIPGQMILKVLLHELLDSSDALLHCEVAQIAADYDYRMRMGSKPIFHLEAFVAKFMALYKQFIDEAFLEDFD